MSSESKNIVLNRISNFIKHILDIDKKECIDISLNTISYIKTYFYGMSEFYQKYLGGKYISTSDMNKKKK